MNNFQINKYFEGEISNEYVKIHLPGDFHWMLNKFKRTNTIAIIGKQLIDAINKLNAEKNSGNEMLKDCKSIYMSSPIFYAPTFSKRNKFLSGLPKKSPVLEIFEILGADTKTITIGNLYDKEFILKNEEANYIIKNFGKDKNIGIIKIPFDKINSKKFQCKLKIIDKIINARLKNIKIEER